MGYWRIYLCPRVIWASKIKIHAYSRQAPSNSAKCLKNQRCAHAVLKAGLARSDSLFLLAGGSLALAELVLRGSGLVPDIRVLQFDVSANLSSNIILSSFTSPTVPPSMDRLSFFFKRYLHRLEFRQRHNILQSIIPSPPSKPPSQWTKSNRGVWRNPPSPNFDTQTRIF